MQRYSNWAIVSDYDGTLTSGIGNSVSEQNIRAIKQFVNEGGRFCIATGRAGFEIDGLMGNSVDFNLPCIFYDGSLIFDYVSRKAIYEKPLPANYKDLLTILIDEFSDVQIFVGNAGRLSLVNAPGYSYEAARDAVVCSTGSAADDKEISEFIRKVSMLRPWDVKETIDKADSTAYKLLFCSSNARISELEVRIAELDVNCEYKVVKPFSFNLEVVSSGAGKETALKWIRDNCFRGNILAIGDGHNDAEMFEVADYSLAPELAHPDAKKAAAFVGGGCEEIVWQALELIDDLSAGRCPEGETMANEQPCLGKMQSR